ncbi:MAG TPA: Ig-like domain-containing protein [Nitrospirota bacterium]
MKFKNSMFSGILAFLFILASTSAFAAVGDIHNFAGTGTPGYTGDGGPAASAGFSQPDGICADAAGEVFISDTMNQIIRKVDASGMVSKVAGTGTAGFAGDGGNALQAAVSSPAGLCADKSGNLYFADSKNNRVRKITPEGVISTIAGNGTAGYSGNGGQAASAALNHPMAIAVDASGNIYIADTLNNCIRKVDAQGTIKTVAGTAAAGFAGDGGPAVSAMVNHPSGVALDLSGNLFIADSNNNRIRVVSTAGVITTFAGNAAKGFAGDGGPAVSASLTQPSGIALDSTGRLLIADTLNQRVRAVASGTMTTVAGTGVPGSSGDDGKASAAMLNGPLAVTADKSGNIYIADSSNDRSRVVEGASFGLPMSMIKSPADGATIADGAPAVIKGTASASSGISSVEVSTDGGATWMTASGTADWSFDWTSAAAGSNTLMSRATDAQGKVEAQTSQIKVSIASPANQPSASAGQSAAPASAGAVGAHFYGSGLSMFSMQNTTVGYPKNAVGDHRFIAGHTGSVASFKCYIQWNTQHAGYAGGNGGSYKVELRADDGTSNHFPSNTVLASTTFGNVFAKPFPLITFSAPAAVQAGQIYHIVWTNIDPSPSTNYVSINNFRCVPTGGAAVPVPKQPTISDDFAVLANYGVGWVVIPAVTPIFQLNYTDGYCGGIGYMESRIGYPKTISGASVVRETFTVSGAGQTVSSAAVRLALSSGSGNLIFRLENGDGSVIEEVPVPASAATAAQNWVKATFKSAHALSAGKAYNLVLKTDSGTAYSAYTIVRGTGYGFSPNTYFSDGYAQYNTGSGWTGWSTSWDKDEKNTDLQFFFNAQ